MPHPQWRQWGAIGVKASYRPSSLLQSANPSRAPHGPPSVMSNHGAPHERALPDRPAPQRRRKGVSRKAHTALYCPTCGNTRKELLEQSAVSLLRIRAQPLQIASSHAIHKNTHLWTRGGSSYFLLHNGKGSIFFQAVWIPNFTSHQIYTGTYIHRGPRDSSIPHISSMNV